MLDNPIGLILDQILLLREPVLASIIACYEVSWVLSNWDVGFQPQIQELQ